MLATFLTLVAMTAQPPQTGGSRLPLGGPAVTTRVEGPSLVSYDMHGRLRDLENSPEHEAVRMLKLSPEAAGAAEAVFTARAARVDAFVTDNLLMFGQLDTAGKAGARLDATMLLARLMERGWPLITEGPLRERVAAALPEADAARFRALLAEYRRAWWKQAYEDARKKGDHPPIWAVALAERGVELGTEIGRSYERQVAAGTLFADYLLAGVTLTDEQRATFRELKMDMLRRTNFKPTEKDQGFLVLGMVAYLPATEREKVAKKIPR